MQHFSWPRLLLALILLGHLPSNALAQKGRHPKRDYVAIPIEGNLEEILLNNLKGLREFKAEQLKKDKKLSDLQRDLIDLMNKDPKQFEGLQEWVKKFQGKWDLRDPKKLKDITKIFEKDPDLEKQLPELTKKKIEDIKKKLEQEEEKNKQEEEKAKKEPPEEKNKEEAVEPPPKKPFEKPADEEDDLPPEGSRKFLEWLEGLEHSKLGELVTESPALQQAMRELAENLLSKDGKGDFLWDNDRFAEQLRNLAPGKFDLSWTQGGLSGVGNLSLPKMNLKLPTFGFGGGFSAPGPGSFSPSAPSGGVWSVLLVILLLVLVGVAVALILRRTGWNRSVSPVAGRSLGGWPVTPEQVTTRAELVAAFEYLALLQLGQEAQTWNHRDLADGLGGEERDQGDRHRAAEELGALYEQARYTPDEELLSDEALAAARRDLRFLAGMANA
jgi:hypothetical protein